MFLLCDFTLFYFVKWVGKKQKCHSVGHVIKEVQEVFNATVTDYRERKKPAFTLYKFLNGHMWVRVCDVNVSASVCKRQRECVGWSNVTYAFQWVNWCVKRRWEWKRECVWKRERERERECMWALFALHRNVYNRGGCMRLYFLWEMFVGGDERE